jgi:hypothetical protein
LPLRPSWPQEENNPGVLKIRLKKKVKERGRQFF